MTEYFAAAICRSGHVRDAVIRLGPSATLSSGETRPLGPNCPMCGDRVITHCESCGTPILGRPVHRPGSASHPYKPPPFCDECGAPHPWLDWQGRIALLKKRLREDPKLDEARRLQIEEQLDRLAGPDLDDEQLAKIAKRVKQLFPAMWETVGLKQVWTTLLTEVAKRQAGLEP